MLIGGLSWLSHEFGLVSDPQNLLDAHIVLGDGRAIWASREADLLWAIRGGRCAFGGMLTPGILIGLVESCKVVLVLMA